MNAMNEMPAPLNFTDAAAEKVRSLIEEEGNPELKLRVLAGQRMLGLPVRLHLRRGRRRG